MKNKHKPICSYICIHHTFLYFLFVCFIEYKIYTMQPTQLVLCSKDSLYNSPTKLLRRFSGNSTFTYASRSSLLREYYNSLNNISNITNTCAHHIIEDLIDITPDHSKYVYYCEKCYECFTSKEYIENRKILHIPPSGFQ